MGSEGVDVSQNSSRRRGTRAGNPCGSASTRSAISTGLAAQRLSLGKRQAFGPTLIASLVLDVCFRPPLPSFARLQVTVAQCPH